MNAEDQQIILAAGAKAPSGDNLQPWRFATSGATISITAVPKTLALAIDQTNTLISCGAALESMVIAAHAIGYEARVAYAPHLRATGPIAEIAFERILAKRDQTLYAAMPHRVTNRKPFAKVALSAREEEQLRESIHPFESEITLHTTDDRHAMRRIAEGVSLNIRHFVENHDIHDYFFGNLRWTQEAKHDTKDGMPIHALQLSALEFAELRLIRSWPLARFFSHFGAGKIASRENIKKYMAAGAFLTLLAKDNRPEDLLEGGRALMRLWLSATDLGLSAQPIAGFIAGQGPGPVRGFDSLSPWLKADTDRAYQGIRDALGLTDESIIFMVRIGKARELEGETLRRNPLGQRQSVQNEVYSSR